YLDADDDGDGTPTSAENADPNTDGDPRDALDSDWDGQPDYLDLPITDPSDGTVAAEQKISDITGGLSGPLDDWDYFGRSIAGVGDLDGGGVVDVVAGAYVDDDGGTGRGAVYVLNLACLDSDSDGLCDLEEDANTDLDNNPATTPGPDTDGDTTPNYLDSDDDGDGTPTASENADPNADGDPRDALDSDRDGEPDYLDLPITIASGGTVGAEQKISDITGGFTGPLDDYDWFGASTAS
ncbi:MAG: hypothetical protein GY724_18715, partial [Actinomycetia bacterium]|nr:hypothetical protein [Actinomycetes bacterium]